ncbi:hypothetical protein BGZ60DRAFT_430630 [Tricladium varicosporioides]|nr:hypothetical protein BGZ60DRAFT_430630 [Hymenoscyphus varicosporioides]
MAPAGPGGRPRNRWTSSRRRKLARLYVLTDLSNGEIEKVLETQDFHPKYRDIQNRRRSLFSDELHKRHNEYRPTGSRNMKLRTTIVRQSENYRVSKSRRYKNALQDSKLLIRQSIGSLTRSSVEPISAFRNYADAQAPLHLDALSGSQPTNSWRLMLDGSSVSSQSTPSSTHHVTFQVTEPISEKVHPPGCNVPETLRDWAEGDIESSTNCFLRSGVCLEHVETNTLNEVQPSLLQLPRFAVADMQASQVVDRGSKDKPADGLARLARRLSSRSPDYIQHVYSILRFSMTGSSSSSLSYGSTLSKRSSWMSFASEKSRNSEPLDISKTPSTTEISISYPLVMNKRERASSKARWSPSEREIWEEMVDESQLLSCLNQRPDYQETSLINRKCCGFNDKLAATCKVCGFGRIHAWARREPGNLSTFPSGESLDAVDHYGNSPLHYSAASGKATSSSLLSLIERGADALLKNSSNQTFLHVLDGTGSIFTGGIEDFALLIRLKDLQFPFSDQDYHGRALGHSIDPSLLSNLLYHGLLDRSSKLGSVLDNQGFQLPGIPKQINLNHTIESINTLLTHTGSSSANFVTRIDDAGDTPLIALLKKWKDSESQGDLYVSVTKLIAMGAVVDMRDRKGYTALAIATIQGTRPCVKALLDAGASIHSRSYAGKGILMQALGRVRDAKREKKDSAYARLLSCVNLLVDRGAKLDPTERDEWLSLSTKTNETSSDKIVQVSSSKRKRIFSVIRGKDKSE